MSGPERLGWSEFVSRYYPGSHRHDLKPLIAYAAYRGAGAEPVDSMVLSAPVLVWEWEGGALASVPRVAPAKSGERHAAGAAT